MSAMRFDVLTLFDEQVRSFFNFSMTALALEKGLIEVHTTNIRDFTDDRHHTADDAPYGGGNGMVLKAEPVFKAVEKVKADASVPDEKRKVVLLSASGKLFNQNMAREFSTLSQLILICGHYEGVDERVRRHLADEEVSIGDYVLTGGEPAACVVVDAVARCVPGVLGNAGSLEDESFTEGILEYPHYTRPEEFRGYRVPQILLTGHHENIRRWRRLKALEKTFNLRAELLESAPLTDEDKRILNDIVSGNTTLEGEES